VTELLTASSGRWQCPAVSTVSASTRVTEQVDTWTTPAEPRSTETIMPTLRATPARTSVGSVTTAVLSQWGGWAQYQNVS
jgi:hypothetical protein